MVRAIRTLTCGLCVVISPSNMATPFYNFFIKFSTWGLVFEHPARFVHTTTTDNRSFVFCAEDGLVELPASDLTASLFLVELINEKASVGIIQSTCFAITFAHSLADTPSLCNGPWSSRVCVHAKCTCQRPSQANNPTSSSDIYRGGAPFLASHDIRDFLKGVILLLMYAAFLCFSNIGSL